MKVKTLRNLLYKLSDDEDVVLLNDAAPITSTNAITSAVIIQEPVEQVAEDDREFSNKLVLTYSTRERGER